ncbi:MAG: helix-turn-helix transcriptional regulator [Candidatus Eisenbacteria bacterium]
MAPKADLRVHLRRFRKTRDLTQQDLADRLGVTRQTIISIEKGKYRPSIELALLLAREFACPVEDLFELVEGDADGLDS